MSKLLDQLKQAEAQRERLAAGRAAAPAVQAGALEAEAARLADLRREIEREKLMLARLVEERRQVEAQPSAPESPPARSPWRWLAAPAAAALGFALYHATLSGPVSQPNASAGPPPAYSWGLRFDRDDAAFAARANQPQKEKK